MSMRTFYSLDAAVSKAVCEFVDDLKRIRRDAGDISYRDIQRLSGRSISATSVCRLLAEPTKLPGWQLIKSYLIGCGVDQKTIDSWFTRWRELADLIEPIAQPERGQADGQDDGHLGSECSECGAWMINAERHAAWHAGLPSRRARRPQLRVVGQAGDRQVR
jgi:hypothetical protein